MKFLKGILTFLFLVNLQANAQVPDSLADYLSQISFHQKTDSVFLKNEAIIRKIEITEFSFIVDGNDVTYPDPYEDVDSTTSFLLGIDQGEVIPFGDAGGYLLVVKTDSVLAFRVAYQTIPIQEADSLYTRNKNKIFDRKSWN